MENEVIKHLMKTNETLIESNHRLTVVTKINIEKRDALSSICLQIYEGLLKKKKRSKKEEKWYKSLKEVLDDGLFI
jgi:hypothetical protein